MIIDAQSHGIDRKYLEKLVGMWPDKGKLNALLVPTIKTRPQSCDVDLRLEQLERHGIDLQVVTMFSWIDSNVFPGDQGAQIECAKVINDGMAKFMEDSKGKLISCASVPLEAFERGGRQEMERAVKTLGLKGVGITSHVRGKPIDAPQFESFWAQAEEMDLTVIVHPIAPVGLSGRPYEGDYNLTFYFGWPFETQLMLARLAFSGIMERYPKLKVVSHHLGGGLPFFWGRINETYPTLVPDLGRALPKPAFEYFSRFYYDTAIGGSGPAIRCTYEVFGADRVIFATDAPYGPDAGEACLATYPGLIKSLGFSKQDNKKIFEDNARRIFNLA